METKQKVGGAWTVEKKRVRLGEKLLTMTDDRPRASKSTAPHPLLCRISPLINARRNSMRCNDIDGQWIVNTFEYIPRGQRGGGRQRNTSPTGAMADATLAWARARDRDLDVAADSDIKLSDFTFAYPKSLIRNDHKVLEQTHVSVGDDVRIKWNDKVYCFCKIIALVVVTPNLDDEKAVVLFWPSWYTQRSGAHLQLKTLSGGPRHGSRNSIQVSFDVNKRAETLYDVNRIDRQVMVLHKCSYEGDSDDEVAADEELVTVDACPDAKARNRKNHAIKSRNAVRESKRISLRLAGQYCSSDAHSASSKWEILDEETGFLAPTSVSVPP